MSDKKPLVNYSGEIKEIASTDVIPVVNGGVDPTAWTSWTPTWTGITMGNAVTTYRYKQIGKTVLASIDVTFGTTTTTSGAAQTFTLPITSISRITASQLGQGIGTTSASFPLVASYKTTSDAYLLFLTTGASSGAATTYTSSAFSWANGHKLSLQLLYEAA